MLAVARFPLLQADIMGRGGVDDSVVACGSVCFGLVYMARCVACVGGWLNAQLTRVPRVWRQYYHDRLFV